MTTERCAVQRTYGIVLYRKYDTDIVAIPGPPPVSRTSRKTSNNAHQSRSITKTRLWDILSHCLPYVYAGICTGRRLAPAYCNGLAVRTMERPRGTEELVALKPGIWDGLDCSNE